MTEDVIVQKDELKNVDLFGNTIEENPLLRDKFIEPPFSILDAKSGNWQRRKRMWKSIGIKSEVGRTAKTFNMEGSSVDNNLSDTSIFDPALCEVLYHWFLPDGGTVLDPFAGGSVRGVVANYLGYKYTGIDIRSEQIDSNIEQGVEVLGEDNLPNWIVGDSDKVLDNIHEKFDFIFSCPPYAYLEVYSDLEGDISNMTYEKFIESYRSIINKSCQKLKVGGFACFVVGEIRDKKGNYIGFVKDTIDLFMMSGVDYYNECILLNAIGTAPQRAAGNMKSKKVVKVHQNVLVFRKPEL